MYSCRQSGCNFTAVTAREVQVHAKDEHGLRLLPCVKCNFQLFCATELYKHHKNHHAGEKVCTFCKQELRSYNRMSEHISDSHKMEIGMEEPAQALQLLPSRNLVGRMNEVIRFPANFTIMPKQQFIVVYDLTEGRPIFVFEDLDPETMQATKSSYPNGQFREDPNLPRGQVTPEAVKYLDFDNGHLAASRNHSNSNQAHAETYLMSNISPMHRDVNSGVWCSLEMHVRNLASKWSAVRVISGPIYNEKKMPKKRSLGCVMVSIPTHFFKVVFMERPGEPELAQAFIVPNTNYENPKSCFSYRRTMADVEALTGLKIIGKTGRSMFWDVVSASNFSQKRKRTDAEDDDEVVYLN